MEEYKIVLFGSSGAGKTALINRFVNNVFNENSVSKTISDQFYIEKNRIKYYIHDTAGQEEFNSPALRETDIKSGQGFLLVYSITSLNSLEDLQEIQDQIKKVKNTVNVPMILVGNKNDLEHEQRVVSKDQGQALACRFHCRFMEASAKSKLNVDNIFDELVFQIKKKTKVKKRDDNCTIA